MKKTIILIGLLLISFALMASVSADYSETITQNQCSGVGNPYDYAYDTEFIFTNVPAATGDGTLTVSVKGDYSGDEDERVYVWVEGTQLELSVPNNDEYDDCLCEFITGTITVTKEQINEWRADGQIVVTLEQGEDVQCFCGVEYCHCDDYDLCTNTNVVTLEYPTGAVQNVGNYDREISKNLICEDGEDNAYDTEFIFTNLPVATGNGTLTVKIKGDYNGYDDDEYVEVFVEGTSLGVFPEGENKDWQCSCEFLTRTFTVTQAQINQWAADGRIEVTLVQGEDVDCFCGEEDCQCEDNSKCTNTNMVRLKYPGGAKKSLPMDWIMKKFGLGNKDKE